MEAFSLVVPKLGTIRCPLYSYIKVGLYHINKSQSEMEIFRGTSIEIKVEALSVLEFGIVLYKKNTWNSHDYSKKCYYCLNYALV